MAKGPKPPAGNTDGSGRRASAALRRRDEDHTDPNASVEEIATGDEASDVVRPGPDDMTQVHESTLNSPAQFKLLIIAGPKAGTEFELKADEITLGRGTDNALTIPDVSVSRRHVRIARSGDGVVVTDLNSGNGTKVNGTKVTTSPVTHGDEIALGDTVLQLLQVGAPAVKARKAPQTPSGSVAPPNATTQSELAKVVPIAPKAAVKGQDSSAKATRLSIAKAELPAPPPPASVAAPAPPKKSNRRLVMYAVLAVLLIVGFAAAKQWKNKHGGSASPGGVDTSLEKDIAGAIELMQKHHWADALAALEKLPENDANVRHFTDGAKWEVTNERVINAARAALSRGEFAGARDLLKGIPEDSDLWESARGMLDQFETSIAKMVADATNYFHAGDRAKALELLEKVLAYDASRADALALKAEINKPVKVVGPVVKEAPRPIKEAPIKVEPKKDYFGPALTGYLQGDIKGSIRLANERPETADFAGKLQKFSDCYSAGQQAAAGRHLPDAAKNFKCAMDIDRTIRAGRPPEESKLGTEVRKQLAVAEYLLALDCKGDEMFGRRAAHLLAALEADPNNDAAHKQYDRVCTHANELFQDAYQQKGTAGSDAPKLFKYVAGAFPEGAELETAGKFCPTGPETKRKALLWLSKMGGGGQ